MFRPMRLIAAAIMATSLLSLPPAAAGPAPTVPGSSAEADWVMQTLLPDGAIAHFPDRVMVRPYLSHFAAIGLIHAYRSTREPRYIEAAWRWLAWYQSHMDAVGYVTDYDLVSGGQLVSTGDMDSTDSYAAMFLVAIYNAHQATGNTTRTADLRTGVAKAVGAILSTQEADGLTWSKPSYKVKYLMDQAETYAGLRAGAWLAANVLAAPALSAQATKAAVALQAGVDRLWNPGTGAYDWAVHENGARTRNTWANLYPDALSQVWAVAFGLVDGDPVRANAILQRFETTHPRWDQPVAIDQFDSGPHLVEYWPVAGWAFARMGNQARADEAAARIGGASEAAGRAWPFHAMAAGQLISLKTRAGDLLPHSTSVRVSGTAKPTRRLSFLRFVQ